MAPDGCNGQPLDYLPGMRLELTPTDLATILSALPGLPCERLEVAIEGERVIVTLCTVDYLRMVPNANAMVRMALSA